ncbi:DUF899 family protein [Actinomadura sp. 6N118]|uniref:DUF899 family protein n=1 Tax=Actinomadura sp. 6N118 TaxID=3375151 RepID=UPI003790EEDC
MDVPPVVSAREWQNARNALLVREKEVSRELAAARRRLPMVRIDRDEYETPAAH